MKKIIILIGILTLQGCIQIFSASGAMSQDSIKNKTSTKRPLSEKQQEHNFCNTVFEIYSKNQDISNPFIIYKNALEQRSADLKDKPETQKEIKTTLNKLKTSEAQRAEMSIFIEDIKKNCISETNTKQSNTLKEFVNKIITYYTKEEQQIIANRTGGKHYCPMWSSDYLLSFNQEKPDKNCIYLIPPRSVQAFQVTDTGILASYNLLQQYGYSISFYFHKTKELSELVDGSYVTGLFVYTGPYSYQSLTGQRTLYSFRALNKETLLKDIYFL